ncbi:MAG: AAA family ATPase [Phormidesmis sp.]
MAGLSGSGKSTTAQRLAVQAGAIRLRSDAVRKHLAGVPLHEKAGSEVYTAAMTDATYTRLIELGVQLASQGYRVILDAKFDRRAKRQEAVRTAQSHSIPITFLHCTAPADILEARVTARSGDIADANAAILEQQFMEPFASDTIVETVDTTRSMDDIQTMLNDIF